MQVTRHESPLYDLRRRRDHHLREADRAVDDRTARQQREIAATLERGIEALAHEPPAWVLEDLEELERRAGGVAAPVVDELRRHRRDRADAARTVHRLAAAPRLGPEQLRELGEALARHRRASQGGARCLRRLHAMARAHRRIERATGSRRTHAREGSPAPAGPDDTTVSARPRADPEHIALIIPEVLYGLELREEARRFLRRVRQRWAS